jgi:hypothetical protein
MVRFQDVTAGGTTAKSKYLRELDLTLMRGKVKPAEAPTAKADHWRGLCDVVCMKFALVSFCFKYIIGDTVKTQSLISVPRKSQ